MLEVVAIKYNDIAPVLPISCQLPEEGGSIGRDDDNAMTLPDPLRLLSRRHLLIAPNAQNAYRVTNVSTANPAIVNDTSLAPGESWQLNHGDTICIGGYLLQVRITDSPELASSCSGATGRIPDLQVAQEGDGHASESLSALAADCPPIADIEAILDKGGTPALISGELLGLASLQPAIGLADLAVDGRQLLDGLEQEHCSATELTQDPLMESASLLLQDSTLDPLALFGDAEKTLEDLLGASSDLKTSPLPGVATPSRPLSDLHMPFSLDVPCTQNQTEVTGDVSHSILIPDEFVLDELLSNPDVAVGSAVGTDMPAAVPFEVQADTETELEVEVQTSAVESEDTTESVAVENVTLPYETANIQAVKQETVKQAVMTSCAKEKQTEQGRISEPAPQDLAALHAALLQGLGLNELSAHRQFDADFIRMLGVLLRTAIDGILKLMAARATVKREVRANVTVISPERNNPLKFSPDVDVALQYLLGRDHPGFMAAEEAVRQAFADLNSHQVGVISGMRAALSLVLERFNPQTISHNVGTQGMLDHLLPMARKARLWDAYGRYFEQAREQAQDRFQEFFGAAFVDAYEAHIASVHAGEAFQTLEACQ